MVLADVPNVGCPGGKIRPALIVQSDHNNQRLNETIVAPISNLSRAHEPTQLLIEVATADGVASGLLYDSVVRCERLLSIPQVDVQRVIGHLSDTLMQQINDYLKAASGMP